MAAARAFHPDVILLDVIMPDGDGGAIAADLRQDPELSRVPILILTAAVRKNELRPGDGLIGGQRYIAKPVKIADLIDHIERALVPNGP